MLQRKRRRVNRDGTAAVEAAFCLPFVITLTMFTIEICSAIFLKESLTIAAYEGARVGVMRRVTTADAEQRTAIIMTARGITGGEMQAWGINGSDEVVSELTDLRALDIVVVEASAPLANNSFFIGRFLGGNRTVRATVRMRREFNE